jgi:ribosomal protein L30/L7E
MLHSMLPIDVGKWCAGSEGQRFGNASYRAEGGARHHERSPQEHIARNRGTRWRRASWFPTRFSTPRLPVSSPNVHHSKRSRSTMPELDVVRSLFVTLRRGTTRKPWFHQRIINALGLSRPHDCVEKPNNASIRGMLLKVGGTGSCMPCSRPSGMHAVSHGWAASQADVSQDVIGAPLITLPAHACRCHTW